MRTTLTIDDDVLRAVKERARLESRTAGEVISDLARRALTEASGRSGTRGRFTTLPRRGVVVTSELVAALLDEDDE